MKWIDAAYTVLRDVGEPLKKLEIADRILERGLRTSRPETPEETIRRDIQQDIKRYGSNSRFIEVSSGVFAVRALDHASPTPPTPESIAGLTAAATRAAGSMSFADATERILREAGSREPMHYEEITDRAISQGLIQPEGKTPAVSLNAIIGTDIRHREARGEPQRFVRAARGMIALAERLPTGLAEQIEQHNLRVREQLMRRLQEGSPLDFENLVADLLAPLDFQEVERTPLGGDGGIDVRGTLVVGRVVPISLAVQAKRWKSNVPSNVVRDFRGGLGMREQGLIITTSDFSKGAREEAMREGASHPIALMSGENLLDLLVEHKVGVKQEPYTLLRLLSLEADPVEQ